jgi:mono/diheme cytochrome c family protein
MRRTPFILSVAVIAAAGAAFWFLSAPRSLGAAALATLEPGDPERGERIFWAGGCTSCHAPPGAEGDARLELGGGEALETAFGTFVAPNISPDPDAGIGAWSEADFANAMLRGVSPDGEHYYPSFPYASYARMDPQDVADLFAFMKTLPPVAERAPDHTLSFPYTLRRGIGLWKLLHMKPDPVVVLEEGASELAHRGQYLVEGPGHCGECHTPRFFTGGQKYGDWLAGAVAAEGDGTIPNITPGEGGIGSWSQDDIAYYLESGFTPDFDSVGGSMAEVQRNIARLPAEDREAIAAYLKAVPPRPDGYSRDP